MTPRVFIDALTRGQFLKAAGGGIAATVVSATGAGAAIQRARRVPGALAATARRPTLMTFRSRPDLRPPALRVRYVEGMPSAAEGYLFVGPTAKAGVQAGPLIVDANGQPVWFHPVRSGWWVSNFKVQEYRGKPVLTWWQGVVRHPGYGRGEGVILDTSYREIARVRAAGGREADLHEFKLTRHGTALITCHPPVVQADLSGVGGAATGQVLESIIQEVDVGTGKLLFEWRSLEHIGVEESLAAPGGIYDYIHVNSIDPTPDGNLLISGRHTCALYKIERHSGRVLWRLGGRRSDFAMGSGTRFHWQHDARHLPGSLISVFDNGAGPVKSEPQSRGLVLRVDQDHRAVRLAHSYRHPHILTSAMGNVQTLPDTNVIISWGLVPALSEFGPNGELLGDLYLPWGYNCYRGFRFPWAATPRDRPAIAVTRHRSSGSVTLYASWNGATDVDSWQVSTGPSPKALEVALTTPRDGFETAIGVPTSQGYAAVTALDADGEALGSTATFAL